MNLFRTLTGEVEMMMVNGNLVWRKIDNNGVKGPGPWRLAIIEINGVSHPVTKANARMFQGILRAQPPLNVKESFTLFCIVACLTNNKRSNKYVEPKSQELKREISGLREKVKDAEQREERLRAAASEASLSLQILSITK